MISQRTYYALRAVLELAVEYGREPVKIGRIAKTQAIPHRFLEVILNGLKQAGFVESRRGAGGGYVLTRAPRSLTVGDVIRSVQGPEVPVSCLRGDAHDTCELRGRCVFLPMWRRVDEAVAGIYDQTSFEDLVAQQRDSDASGAHDYVI